MTGLDLERLIDRGFQPVVDGLEDESRGDGWPFRDLAREGLRVLEGPPVLRKTIDEAERQALLGRNLRAEDHELQRLRATDEPGHPLRAAKARDDAEVR